MDYTTIGVLTLAFIAAVIFGISIFAQSLMRKAQERKAEQRSPSEPTQSTPSQTVHETKRKAEKTVERVPILSKTIGIRSGLFLTALVTQLNKAMKEEYMSHVKERVLKRKKEWSEADYEYHLIELKRFFILNALFKNVPMFSDGVDTIWNKMLIFTASYEQFCREYIGEMIHHMPNVHNQAGGNVQNERALFDMFYLLCFRPQKKSEEIWGEFLRVRLTEKKVAELASDSLTAFQQKYFRDNPHSERVSETLYKQINDQANQSVKNSNLRYRSQAGVSSRSLPASRSNNSSTWDSNYILYSLLYTDNSDSDNHKSHASHQDSNTTSHISNHTNHSTSHHRCSSCGSSCSSSDSSGSSGSLCSSSSCSSSSCSSSSCSSSSCSS